MFSCGFVQVNFTHILQGFEEQKQNKAQDKFVDILLDIP